MSGEIHILILEDLVTDAELIERELRKANISFVSRRVDTKEGFVDALKDFKPQLVLSDYSLPQFSGPEALRLLKQTEMPVPFILVTGSLTEEVAVECMKNGAHDYILKTSLKRLPSAVLNALEKTNTLQEKLRTEAALHRSEEQYRLIAENTSDLICIIDTQAQYVYVSPSYKELLDYSPDDLLSKSCYHFIHPDDHQEALGCLEALPGRKPERQELRLRHKDGSWRLFETMGNWIYDSEGRAQQGILVSRDLTERKNAESALRNSGEQLRQAQKLEAVGQLAGGVAHDFNNLLTVITGYSDLMLHRLTKDDVNRSKVEEIRRAANRASSLTRQLLAFSRKQVLQPKVFDLNGLVADISKMLERLIGEDIELVAILGETAQINADAGQIEQVLMNLAVNARDAMPKGGKLTIETSRVDIDERCAKTQIGVQPGSYVLLAVTDTGMGMEAETLKHIFEPFFTTKEQGKGTGLGLSTVYGIVKQSGGNIWLYSEPNEGTVFKIYLPRVSLDVGVAAVAKVPSIRGGTETVLIVEDDAQIQQLVLEVLAEKGYNVLVSSNGLEALQLLSSLSAPLDLILTDVVMPQMSGRELAERAASIKPDTKVLFMSGYTNDAIVRHGVLDSGTWFIQKPFAADALAARVREVLDANKLLEKGPAAHCKSHSSDYCYGPGSDEQTKTLTDLPTKQIA